MQMPIDRAGLLRRGGVGALVIGAAALGLAPAASAALSDEDLAYARLLIAVELLTVDFQTQALASGRLDSKTEAVLKATLPQEKAHLAGLSSLVTGTGQVPATSDDIDFAYPKDAFSSAEKMAELAGTLETLSLGAYLGAIEHVQAPRWRLPIGQIAASEAQHVAALANAGGQPILGRAFAPSLELDAVSDALDAYES
jgi:hypothetical protein